MKEKINGIDLINFKKLSELLTGKAFNLRSDRGFGKHEKEVGDLLKMVDGWVEGLGVKKPLVKGVKSRVKKVSFNLGDRVPSWKKAVEVFNAEEEVVLEKKDDVTLDVIKKGKIDMDNLRMIASGEELVEKVENGKPLLVDLYDFDIVTNLPDVDDRVYVDVNGLSFCDKYDPGKYYVVYDGRNMMFSDRKEFDRFSIEVLSLVK